MCVCVCARVINNNSYLYKTVLRTCFSGCQQRYQHVVIVIIIRDIYIAPYPAILAALSRFIILLSLTQICFNPVHTSTPTRAYNACCNALLRRIAITSYHVLISGSVNQSSHDSIAAQDPRTRDPSKMNPTLQLIAPSRLDISIALIIFIYQHRVLLDKFHHSV